MQINLTSFKFYFLLHFWDKVLYRLAKNGCPVFLRVSVDKDDDYQGIFFFPAFHLLISSLRAQVLVNLGIAEAENVVSRQMCDMNCFIYNLYVLIGLLLLSQVEGTKYWFS